MGRFPPTGYAGAVRDTFFLSDLLRYKVPQGRLADLSVVLNDDDYPRVSTLWVRKGADCFSVPWEAVAELTHDGLKADFSQLAPVSGPTCEPPEVLLARDVIDGMVLDLQNRRATRANDLLLSRDGRELRLIAADVSVWAALRRLSRGLLWRRPSHVYDWKYVEFLRGDPAGVEHGSIYHGRIGRLPAGDIAALCRAVPYLHAAELVTLLKDELAAEVLQALPATLQRQVVGELAPDYTARLLSLMAPDLAADLLGRLGRDAAEELLNRFSSEKVVNLLGYEADTVGGIMTNDLLVLPEDLTVEEARRVVRRSGPRFVYVVYVTAGSRLKGTLHLVDLVAASSTQKLGELLNPYIASLSSGEPAKAAAYRVLQSGLPAWPVLDSEGRLLGSVTEDIALDYVVPSALSEQLQRVLS